MSVQARHIAPVGHVRSASHTETASAAADFMAAQNGAIYLLREAVSMITRLEDGSAIDDAGRIVYFSIDRFARDICEGGHCFLCGRAPSAVPFNEEHVLPHWLLSDFGLYDKKIHLPNEAAYPYGAYTMRCCVDCNSLLGVQIEGPVSQLLRGGFDAVADHLQTKDTRLLYTWLSLIFLKTHLRDRRFRFHLDQRLGADPLSKEYDWSEFHHTHAVARSFVSGCAVEREALGSFCVFQTATAPHYEHFDYYDLFLAQAAMVRVRDIGLVAVFDDSHASLSDRMEHFSRIDGPLSPIQLREVFVHLSYTNLRLANRPRSYTDFRTDPPRIRTTALPKYVEVQPHEPEVLGSLLHTCVASFLDRMLNRDIEEIRTNVRAGNYTFLYDADGKFIRNSLESLPAEAQC